jgi:ABC-2 type transport system permease protein
MMVLWKLFIASLKMYSRQREALIWNILLPLFMIVLFAFVDFGGLGKIELGIVNQSGENAQWLLDSLKHVQTLSIVEGTREEELNFLKLGDRDVVLLIPPESSGARHGELSLFTNDGKPQEGQLAALIVQRVCDDVALKSVDENSRANVSVQQVQSRNLTYIDRLIPGILAMSIMQTGIFGVAFGFVGLKKRGILRRLWVTPINPNDFIIAQVATRLIVLVIQIVIMIGCGIIFFDLHFIGSFLDLFLVGILGGIVFLAIGFAISGISKSEDQVAPIANLITLPMILLGGVFFSRSNLPGIVHTITDVFPLTYLADGLRTIAIDGATLGDIIPQLVGLLAWSIVSILLAVKMFRWE